jgi:hypothetical protein
MTPIALPTPSLVFEIMQVVKIHQTRTLARLSKILWQLVRHEFLASSFGTEGDDVTSDGGSGQKEQERGRGGVEETPFCIVKINNRKEHQLFSLTYVHFS